MRFNQIADHQEYNEKGDVYSFSLIMWEMLAGQKPFLGEMFGKIACWVTPLLCSNYRMVIDLNFTVVAISNPCAFGFTGLSEYHPKYYPSTYCTPETGDEIGTGSS